MLFLFCLALCALGGILRDLFKATLSLQSAALRQGSLGRDPLILQESRYQCLSRCIKLCMAAQALIAVVVVFALAVHQIGLEARGFPL